MQVDPIVYTLEEAEDHVNDNGLSYLEQYNKAKEEERQMQLDTLRRQATVPKKNWVEAITDWFDRVFIGEYVVENENRKIKNFQKRIH